MFENVCQWQGAGRGKMVSFSEAVSHLLARILLAIERNWRVSRGVAWPPKDASH